MHILECAKKVKQENEEWKLIKLNPSQIKILEELGVIDADIKQKRKRGRPRKNNV